MTSESVQSLCTAYEDQGIVYLKDFLDQSSLVSVERDIRAAEQLAMDDLKKHWNGEKVTFFTKNPVKAISEKSNEDFVVTDYFQRSSESVHVFFEEIENKLVLNRLGHGLHLQKELKNLGKLVFENPSLHAILNGIGYKKPICLLSVYIPKLPNGFGSEVRPHQESTFAHTVPLSSCVLWVALEDATIENACMYGLPKSHKLPLKFVSQVDHGARRRDYMPLTEVDIPEFAPQRGPYVPLEVKAGEAVLFHGNYVHCSPKNMSNKSRRALSFQFVETEGVSFSSFNWIKHPNARRLYG